MNVYTLSQVIMFHNIIVKEGAYEKAEQIENTAMGASCVLSGGKAVQEAIDQLRRV